MKNATIITPARRVRIEEFEFCFEYPGTGSGYGFPCDAAGNIDESKLSHAAIANLQLCRAGYGGLVSRGVIDYSRTVREDAVAKCGQCGREFLLDDAFLNTCDCGSDYDGTGHLLAPREQWGEETGETFADIVGPEMPETY